MRGTTFAHGVVAKFTRTSYDALIPELLGSDPGCSSVVPKHASRGGSSSSDPNERDVFVIRIGRVDETDEGLLGQRSAMGEQAKGAGDVQEGRRILQTSKRAEASPPPGRWTRTQAGSYGVKGDVAMGFEQMLVSDDVDRAEAPPEEVSPTTVLPVEPLSVDAAQMLHSA
jgi:hypothetical protein